MEHFPEFVANHLFLFALLVSVLMLLFWNLFGTSLSGVTMVNPRETVHMLNHEGAVVLDLRSPDNFGGGHILGAGNIPADRIGERQNELAKYKGKTIILCCNSGNESIRSGRILKLQGFEKVYCLKGGVQAWRSANLPLVRDTDGNKNSDKEGTTDD